MKNLKEFIKESLLADYDEIESNAKLHEIIPSLMSGNSQSQSEAIDKFHQYIIDKKVKRIKNSKECESASKDDWYVVFTTYKEIMIFHKIGSNHWIYSLDVNSKPYGITRLILSWKGSYGAKNLINARINELYKVPNELIEDCLEMERKFRRDY